MLLASGSRASTAKSETITPARPTTIRDMERWISAVTVMELYAAPSISPQQQEKMSHLLEGLSGMADITAGTARRQANFWPGTVKAAA